MTTSVLLLTLPPTTGGVPVKTCILARFLRRSGYDVTIAHYATMTEFGSYSAPSWQMIGGKKPTIGHSTCFGDFPSIAVGCWMPELEFNYYRPSPRWDHVISGFDRHIAVGGTVLVSNPLVELNVPHMTWCASTMIDDRFHRRRAMPLPRRLIDKTIVGPFQRAMEKRILTGDAHFMTVSNYARDTLIAAGGTPDRFATVPVPVDLDRFSPPQTAPTGIIGFAGRADDPRKNIVLLLDAVKHLIDRGESISLKLTGTPNNQLTDRISKMGLSDHVTWTGWLGDADLVNFYKSLDVFVFPSGKEGLGIAGVEAMACGVPVVSTRAGGTEDFVINGETGTLVDDDPREMADAISAIYSDRAKREILGRNARALTESKYNMRLFENAIVNHWQKTWGETL